jgi:hypothetical protein
MMGFDGLRSKVIERMLCGREKRLDDRKGA